MSTETRQTLLPLLRAWELQLGASGAWDHALGNVLFGAVSRRFVDADTTTNDPDDGWEYAIDVRPLARLGAGFFAGADVSYQARFARGLNPITLRAQDPAVFQIAPMLVYSPMGPSAYDRPQLRLVYRAMQGVEEPGGQGVGVTGHGESDMLLPGGGGVQFAGEGLFQVQHLARGPQHDLARVRLA